MTKVKHPMDAGQKGQQGDRVVSRDARAARHRRPGLRQRQDHRGHRPDGRAARPRARGRAVQGRPGLHRPRLPRARDRPSGPQPRPVLVGEDRIAPLFAHGAAGAEIAVIEGVMGLFDGRTGAVFGSTAHVAALLGAPVVLVVDAAAQGARWPRCCTGSRSFDPAVRRGRGDPQPGRVRPARADAARRARRDRAARARRAAPRRRGLGAVAPPRPGPGRRAPRRGRCDRSTRWAPWSPPPSTSAVLRPGPLRPAAAPPPWDAAAEVGTGRRGPGPGRRRRRRRVHLRLRRDTTSCSPRPAPRSSRSTRCGTRTCPAGTGGLVIGGGFPEVHAAELSANAALRRRSPARAPRRAGRRRVRRPALPGAASWTARRCAGVLDADGRDDAPADPRLPGGRRRASRCWPGGERVSGHEFHRTAVTARGRPPPAWHCVGADRPEGFVGRRRARVLPAPPLGRHAAIAGAGRGRGYVADARAAVAASEAGRRGGRPRRPRAGHRQGGAGPARGRPGARARDGRRTRRAAPRRPYARTSPRPDPSVVFALDDRGGVTQRRARRGTPRPTACRGVPRRRRTVAFATIGDPNLYSTFTYLAQTVRALRCPGVDGRDRPGITAMQDLAARAGTVLAEGTESAEAASPDRGTADLRARARGRATPWSPTSAAGGGRGARRRRATPAGSATRCTARGSACPARTSGPPG